MKGWREKVCKGSLMAGARPGGYIMEIVKRFGNVPQKRRLVNPAEIYNKFYLYMYRRIFIYYALRAALR